MTTRHGTAFGVCDTTRAEARNVVGLNDPARGVVAVTCPTGATHLGTVAHDLFEALGQTSTATGNRVRTTRDQVPLLVVALLARPVAHVVVDDAQRLGASAAVALVQTCLAAGALPTLAHRGPPGPRLAEVLDVWPHQRERWPARRRTLQRHLDDQHRGPDVGQPGGAAVPDRFPPVPADEFPRFLSACTEQLGPDDLELVRSEHRRVRDAARETLDRVGSPGPEDVLAVVRRLLRDATNPHHAVTTCRAVAAAAFHHRVLLTADAATLAATLDDEPWYRARTTTDWEPLHRYRRPARAAATVLAATGLDATATARLRVDDCPALVAAAPAAARPHLRRLWLHRVAAGATGGDPLLSLADGRPVDARWVRETLLATGRSLDGPAERARRPSVEADHPWARRLGISARRVT